MWKSSYSDIFSYVDDHEVFVKRGIFGKKLVNENNHRIVMPRKSKVKFMFTDNGVKLYVNGSELASETFDKIWFDSNNKKIMYASIKEKGTMKIDCSTGKHTPFCEDIRYNRTNAKYCIDMQGNILELHNDCTTTPTGLKKIEEHSDSVHIVCKDENGKYMVLDIITLKPIVDLGFEDGNVSCILINSAIGFDPTLRIVSNNRDHYLVDKNYEVLHSIKCDSVTKMNTENGPIKTVRCYDKERNKTTLINFDSISDKIIEIYEVNNLVCDIIMQNKKTYLITADQNNKMGIIDKDNNTIVPSKYDSINAEYIQSGKTGDSKYDYKNELLFTAENDHKKGLFDTEGKNILPCEYKDILLDKSFKLNDNYRFFAQNENDLYGVVNSKGKIEAEFVYEIPASVRYEKIGNKEVNSNLEYEQRQYEDALLLHNTKTNLTDYYVQYGQKCLIDENNADHQGYAPRTSTTEASKNKTRDPYRAVELGIKYGNMTAGVILESLEGDDKIF